MLTSSVYYLNKVNNFEDIVGWFCHYTFAYDNKVNKKKEAENNQILRIS